MLKKSKMLLLTSRYPYPVIGGDRLRIYEMSKELSCTYDITLLSLCETKEELQADLPQDSVYKNIVRVLLPKWRSYLNCLMALPSKRPLQIAYFHSDEFERKVHELLPQHDVVLAHLVRAGHYLLGVDKPKILEMTDAISMNYERVSKVAKLAAVRNYIYSIEQMRLKRYELQMIDHFDVSVLVSQVDKSYLFADRDDQDNVLVCSNGVNLDLLPMNYQPDGRTIIFIGNMRSVPNLDAVKWFAKRVMPILMEKGDFIFKIIGRIYEKDRLELNSIPGVVATGEVESVADIASGAFVGVCPVRFGSGVQNKILEYMALGIPAVTSTIGFEGLQANENSEILIANSEAEYVETLINLSINLPLAEKLSINGRKYVEANHGWSNRLSSLVERAKGLVVEKEIA